MATYKDIKLLGRGGFADVWLCQREIDNAYLARKQLFATIAPKGVERFRQEVRVLSKLDHPNIIKIIETQLATPPYWYVMPLYKASLRDELTRIIGNEARVYDIFSAILTGVEYAHSEGVIHRDLKPHNVLLNADNDLVVTDFGICRILDAEGDRFTNTGARMGSVWYMSPEQSTDAKRVDHRSDIFSLGRILYELFTERLNSALQDLRRLPPAIAPLVERCTQAKPANRFQTVSDLKEAWRTATKPSTSQDTVDFRRLLSEVQINPAIPSNVESLFSYLALHKDPDFVRDAIMQIPPEAAGVMLSLNQGLLRSLLHDFIEHITEHTWGVTYADRLGLFCGNLYVALNDAVTRADLLYGVLLVGVKNKRYGVLETFAQLVQLPRNSADNKVALERLNTAPPHVRTEVSKWLDLDDLDPQFATLFRG